MATDVYKPHGTDKVGVLENCSTCISHTLYLVVNVFFLPGSMNVFFLPGSMNVFFLPGSMNVFFLPGSLNVFFLPF